MVVLKTKNTLFPFKASGSQDEIFSKTNNPFQQGVPKPGRLQRSAGSEV